ncbi:probable inactive poly [ADP-ribose] polymerase SRO1 [Cryptomeria japonica]|uniref:probable inactive poly [ADP-ribose] polymerase SRO1 n=1 Tax=Cryptomeria japonica TaxID=3369 RepID=UPI0027DAA668|nr:probable inactive poly [ADP-ribose] polymerase SRO1 [Cryptomeria japonica]
MDVRKKFLYRSLVNKAKLKGKRAVTSYPNAKKRSLVSSAKRAKIPCGFVKCCSHSKAVVENYSNLKKSGIPARVMYFDQGDWMEFRSEIAVLFKQVFREGKIVVEVAIDGLPCLVDFLHMLLINLNSGAQRSIAWIDIDGKCFFPRILYDPKSDRHCTSNNGFEPENCKVVRDGDPKSVQAELGSIDYDSCDSEGPTSARVCIANEAFEGAGDNLIKLGEDEQEFADVRNKFLAGLRMLATFTSIIGIYRNLHGSVVGQSRLNAFQGHIDNITRKNGGDANVQCAWHGTSRDGICGIIKNGFVQPVTPKHGAVYGNGVYLAPANRSHVSAVYSDIDKNGEQHMLLCRVILGNTEVVIPGTRQCHPSNEDFDSGIDDIIDPTRYIVWSTHMNTHILPEYVVSFKVSPHVHEYLSKLKARQHARLVPETVGGRPSDPASDKKSGQMHSSMNEKMNPDPKN